MIRDCVNSTDLPSFHLTAENIKRKPSEKVAYTHNLKLEYNGIEFAMLQNFVVQVDGVTVTPPVNHPSGVTLRDVGLFIVSQNNQQFEMSMDSHVSLEYEQSYKFYL